MRVVSGMVNKMEIRRERLRDGAKFRIALAAQVVKGEIARLQGRAQIGLPGKGGRLQHLGQRRAVVPAA